MGRLRTRCTLGFDLNTQVHHGSDEPGIVGAAIYGAIFIDQHSKRSHPNKAVDVVVCQTFWIDSGSRFIYSGPALQNKSRGDCPLAFGLFSLPPGRLSCRRDRCRHRVAQRLVKPSSPLTHSRWSNTASFRATATAALFFAFFPPRSQSFNPYRRRSVSGPNGPKMYCALPTSSLRTIVSPALLIPNCGWLSPESSCFGTNPRYGPTSRLFANRCGFSKVNA